MQNVTQETLDAFARNWYTHVTAELMRRKQAGESTFGIAGDITSCPIAVTAKLYFNDGDDIRVRDWLMCNMYGATLPHSAREFMFHVDVTDFGNDRKGLLSLRIVEKALKWVEEYAEQMGESL